MNNLISIICKSEDGKKFPINIGKNKKIKDLIEMLKATITKQFKKKRCVELKLYFKEKLLDPSLSIIQCGLKNNDVVISKDEIYYIEEGFSFKKNKIKKEINIQFLKIPEKENINNSNVELTSLLKLCLLKEISAKISPNQLEKLPDLDKSILEILKNGYVTNTGNLKEDIKKIINKVEGSNIINFSKFVDNAVDSIKLNKIINLLNKEQISEINDIKNRLSRYENDIKIFDKQFSEALKNSIFEFSVVSLAVIEREGFVKFDAEKKKCKNRVDKLLFHGTGEEPVACILTGYFRKSIDKCYQHGKGVYFSDMIDYAWYYGGINNRDNLNKIPKKDATFTLIVCSTYYDKKGYMHVYDHKRTPKKNEINFAWADAETDTIKKFDETNKTKFYGTEYVIWDLIQICPFIGAKLKRAEYCCIWRDTNFAKDSIFDEKTSKMFKDFLAERMKYIEQYAEFNIYPCETSEEALKIIKRKKYNKIILISNISLGGKEYVDKAREIIENDVVVLFLAYDKEHLKWVKDYKNALFSNIPNLFEKYLNCFSSYNRPNFSDSDVKEDILKLKGEIESHYNVKFNFDDNFINFPLYKDTGKFSDLEFK